MPPNTNTRLRFTVPTPPTKQNTLDNPDETLAWLNKCLRELITAFKQLDDVNASPALDPGAYMALYAAAHDYTLTRSSGDPNAASKRLYDDLADTIRSHCKGLRAELFQLHTRAAGYDVAVLESYVREWKRHNNLANFVARIYSYMDRHYAKPAESEYLKHPRDQGKANVLSIQDLFCQIWGEEVVIGSSASAQDPAATNDELASIMEVAVRVRDGNLSISSEQPSEPASKDLLQQVFDTFEAAGVKIGTWHATEEDRMLRPEIVAKHKTLRSGLKITSRVPLAPGNGLWTGSAQ